MLSNSLNTNQIKDAAGAEIEFEHQEQNGRTHIWRKVSMNPSLPYTLKVAHEEKGTGVNRVRKSMIRVDKASDSDNVEGAICTSSCHVVLTAPVGHIDDTDELKAVLANMLSFLATTGAGTTVLFDCTGTGADALINGSV